jgi:hypothetical protein
VPDSIWPEDNEGMTPLPAPGALVAGPGTPPHGPPPGAVKGTLVNPVDTGVGHSPGWFRTTPGPAPALSVTHPAGAGA